METILIFTFWITAGLIVYTWILYPLGLYLLSRIVKLFRASSYLSVETFNGSSSELPSISVIVAAYNEEKVIARRIENLLEQDYPKDKMEIIVASDGSTDRTVEIAKEYESRGVKVLDFKENRGRASVHNDAVDVAKGEILVFTDAETIFEKDFIKNIVKWYKDSRVGCVTGKLIYLNTKDKAVASSEGLYFKYETTIRNLESLLNILVVATGAAMSCRKSLYESIKESEDVDVVIPLLSVAKNYKNIFEPQAIAYDTPPSSMIEELKYRYRDSALSLAGTLRMTYKNFYQFLKRPLLLLSLISHRILRWASPILLIGLFVLNLKLVGYNEIYFIIFSMQVVFYMSGLIGWLSDLSGKPIPIVSSIYSFIIANIGILGGIVKFLAGKASSAYES